MPACVAAWMGLDMAGRRMVTKEMKSRYLRGSCRERLAILDELCALTGWHRDHARKAIRSAPMLERSRPLRQPRVPVVKYDEAALAALRVCWATLDGRTGKRLAPGLAVLVAALRQHAELDVSDELATLLRGMSAATIDRRLAPDRKRDNHLVRNKAAHIAVGVDCDGIKHVLGSGFNSRGREVLGRGLRRSLRKSPQRTTDNRW